MFACSVSAAVRENLNGRHIRGLSLHLAIQEVPGASLPLERPGHWAHRVTEGHQRALGV